MASSQKQSLILILDVQSALVRGSLVCMNGNARSRVVYSTETYFPYHKDKGTTHHIDAIIKGIEETVHECLVQLHRGQLGKDIPHAVDQVHYVLTSPWIISRAQTVNVKFDTETKISMEKVSAAIADQRSSILNGSDTSFEIIEEKVFDVRLNGYQMSDWHGRKAHSMEISFALSIAGSQTIRQFRDACAHAVSHDRVVFHSSLLLQHIAIQELLSNAKNYSLIHIHGELTDVVQVAQGVCTIFGSYPIGSNTCVRTGAEQLRLSSQSADSTISLYEHGQLDSAHGKSTHAALHKIQHGWAIELEKMLSKAGSDLSLKGSLIISAHAHELFFTDALKTIPHHGTVERLDIDLMQTHLIFEGQHRNSRMTGLYVTALRNLIK
jgi:cell division ATPase FtsA